MEKKWATVVVIVLILIFAGYIVIDVALRQENAASGNKADSVVYSDQWVVFKEFKPGSGKLKSVAVTFDGKIFLGGESFLSCYSPDFSLLWSKSTVKPITAITSSGDTVFASTTETILSFNNKGDKIGEWGPFADSAIITSVTANKRYIAFADAGSKSVFILSKHGNLVKIIGNEGTVFIIPSPYFDVALSDDNRLFVANTGKRQIESRRIDGTTEGSFGEAGTDPDGFCGCCNPAHFALIPGGFVTAEKGINRIKILDRQGEFVEFVSVNNKFKAQFPLDVASYDGKTIYAANPADSKVYVFKRK